MEKRKGKFFEKSFLKKATCLFLVFVLFGIGVMFSGCAVLDDVPDVPQEFFSRYIAGVNAVYANRADGGYSGLDKTQDKINDLSKIIYDLMIAFYGSGEDAENEFLPYNSNAPFYDSIRILVTNKDGNANFNESVRWNWFIDPLLKEAEIELVIEEDATYSDWKSSMYETFKTVKYSFPDYFSNVLQIALYEIMLGKEPTTLNVSANGETYEVYVGECSNSAYNGKLLYKATRGTEEVSDSISKEIKEELQKEYLSKTRYIGLTKQNADKFISYILNEIIGGDLVSSDFNSFKSDPTNFRNYVSTIAYLIYSQSYDQTGDEWTYVFENGATKISYTFSEADRKTAISCGLSSEGKLNDDKTKIETDILGSFRSQPATYAKFFEGESFFEETVNGDSFAGKPYAEYQSLILVPANNSITQGEGGLMLLEGFYFNFMSKNKNLKINTTIRFMGINSSGQKFFYEFEGDQIDFSKGEYSYVNANGETCYENDYFFGIDTNKIDPSLVTHKRASDGYENDYFTVGFFNNDVFKSVTTETRLTDSSAFDLQKLYKVSEIGRAHV